MPIEQLRSGGSHPRAPAGGCPGRLGSARRGRGSWTTPSSPASRHQSRSSAARRFAPADALSAGHCGSRVQCRRDAQPARRALWTNQVFKQTEGALAGGRDGAIGALVHGCARLDLAAAGADCLVARCGSKRQRRDSSPHHRVPVRAHAARHPLPSAPPWACSGCAASI